MKERLHLPSILLVSFLIKVLIKGAEFSDAIILTALSSLYFGTYYFKGHKDEPVNKTILDRMVELEEQLRVIKDKTSSVLFSTLRK